MKALYVTDLHVDKDKYRKSLNIALEKGISIIVNGVDMLPKLGERHLEQPLFINEFLRDYFFRGTVVPALLIDEEIVGKWKTTVKKPAKPWLLQTMF